MHLAGDCIRRHSVKRIREIKLKRKHIILLIIAGVLITQSVVYVLVNRIKRNNALSGYEAGTPEYAMAEQRVDHEVGVDAEWFYSETDSFLVCAYCYEDDKVGYFRVAAKNGDKYEFYYGTHEIPDAPRRFFDGGGAYENGITKEKLVVFAPRSDKLFKGKDPLTMYLGELDTDKLRLTDSNGNEYTKIKAPNGDGVLYYCVYGEKEAITDVYAEYSGKRELAVGADSIERAIRGMMNTK